jgi:hypothetical protein
MYTQNLANFLGFFSTPKKTKKKQKQKKKKKKKKKNHFFGVNHIFKVTKNVRICQIKNFVESPISSTKTILWLLAC